MRAGKLGHRVELQASTPVQDGTGQPIDAWATVTGGTVWASIEPISGREFIAAGSFQSEVSHIVTLRWDSTITLTSKFRIKFGSRYFSIVSVRNVEERNRMWELGCKE